MISKNKLKEHIDKFPEEISIDELIERLIFIEKLESRITNSEKGESSLPEDTVKDDIERWSK